MFAFLDGVFFFGKKWRGGGCRAVFVTSYSKKYVKKNHSLMFVSGKLTNDFNRGQSGWGLRNWS